MTADFSTADVVECIENVAAGIVLPVALALTYDLPCVAPSLRRQARAIVRAAKHGNPVTGQIEVGSTLASCVAASGRRAALAQPGNDPVRVAIKDRKGRLRAVRYFPRSAVEKSNAVGDFTSKEASLGDQIAIELDPDFAQDPRDVQRALALELE